MCRWFDHKPHDADGVCICLRCGDLLIVSGLDALERQIRQRLATPRGDFMGAPDFGVDLRALRPKDASTEGAVFAKHRILTGVALRGGYEPPSLDEVRDSMNVTGSVPRMPREYAEYDPRIGMSVRRQR